MNVFQEMIAAIAKPFKYPEFLNNRKRKVFGYGMLLLTIYFLLSIVIPYVRFQVDGGFKENIRKMIPDFEISGGKLWVEEDFIFNDSGIYLEVNTENKTDDLFEYFDEQLNRRYDMVLLLNQDMMIAKNGGEITTLYFSDFEDSVVSRSDIEELIPWVNGIVILGIVLLYLLQLAAFFFGVLILSLFGLIINSIVGANLAFGEVYLLTVYARATPLLLKGLCSLFSISIPYFWILNAGITMVYLLLALQNVKRQRNDHQKTEQTYW